MTLLAATRIFSFQRNFIMSFTESIGTCFRKYVDVNGRGSRSEFWYFQLFLFVLYAISQWIDSAVFGTGFGETGTVKSSSMSVEEAYKILNLDPKKKYTKDEVQKQWKKIISRVHPDISPECQKIASIVNDARDTILKNDFS